MLRKTYYTYMYITYEEHHKTIMVSIFPCYPSGTVLLRTKAIFSKCIRRLISISVNYMLGNRYISYAVIQGTLSVFPCGRTQHVRRMHSRILSMIQSVFKFRFMHAVLHSRLNRQQQLIFQLISVLPFSAKNAFVTAHLLESSLARFKNVACCFQTILCLLNFKEGNK